MHVVDEDGAGETGLRGPVVSRRQVLRAGTVTAAWMALSSSGLATGVSLAQRVGGAPGEPPLVAILRRREDQLWLRFELYNLDLRAQPGQEPQLVRGQRGREAFVVVVFPPQHLAEAAYFQPATEFDPGEGGDETKYNNSTGLEPPEAPPIPAVVARESRLAFLVPEEVDAIPYTSASLLAWADLRQRVVPVALPPFEDEPDTRAPTRGGPAARVPDNGAASGERATSPAQIRAPEATETALELPWRLVLSPHAGAGWAHATEPVTRDGRTELWHTRLGVRTRAGVDEDDARQRTVRAVFALDPTFAKDLKSGTAPPDDDHFPFRMSLEYRDRYDIVRHTSDYRAKTRPIGVDRLMLSSLGAWIDSRGAWDGTASNSLEEWVQRGTMGRDHYSRIVRKGYLLPFGHRASLVKVTERRFEMVAGRPGAYLRQRLYIVVREREKHFEAFGQKDGGRGFPLRTVRATTLTTPDLDAKEAFLGGEPPAKGNDDPRAFMPTVGSKPFPFTFVGTDWDGRSIDLSAPVVFVDSTMAFEGAALSKVLDDYNGLAPEDRRRARPLHGQLLALAESSPDRPGDTSVEVQTLVLAVDTPDEVAVTAASLEQQDQPPFYPRLEHAVVRLTPAEQASGAGVGSTVVEIDATYVQSGWTHGDDGNRAEIFGALPVPAALVFPADRSGGVVTPNLSITGLSRTLGPVGGDLAKLKGGVLDPVDYFKNLKAKILGGIDLFDVVEGITGLSGAPEEALQLVTRTLTDAVETRMTWRPKLRDAPEGLHIFDARGGAASLSIDVLLRTGHGAAPTSTYEIVGDLRNFTMNLIGDGDGTFIIIDVNRLTFTAKDGRKPDVVADIGEVTFTGVLTFVEALRSYLSSSDSGPSLDVSPKGITAGVTVALPSIAVGVFNLSNLALSAELNLPFSGKPVRVRFAFCSRENPFLLTVSLFGGGGFFAVRLGVDGVEQFEAAFEFGAGIALSIGGIASGSVSVVAGIYFSIEQREIDDGGTEEYSELAGYLRMNGRLEVMGVITVSVEFYLELTYQLAPANRLYGKATLTVEVDVLLFSGSVSLTVERTFAGSGPAAGVAASDASDASPVSALSASNAAPAITFASSSSSPAPSNGPPTFVDLVPEALWTDYCTAFVPLGGAAA